jgi:hypothetical protein
MRPGGLDGLAATLLSVTTCPDATGTTLWDLNHVRTLRCLCTDRSDSTSPASMQSHRPRSLDDLPARSRKSIPNSCAHWPACRRLGGFGSSAMARSPHRASSSGYALNRADHVAIRPPSHRSPPTKVCSCMIVAARSTGLRRVPVTNTRHSRHDHLKRGRRWRPL